MPTGYKTGRKARFGFTSTFAIKRSDFGISYMPGAIGEHIRITAGFGGVR